MCYSSQKPFVHADQQPLDIENKNVIENVHFSLLSMDCHSYTINMHKDIQ